MTGPRPPAPPPRHLALDVVAEGVETGAQMDLIQALGCPFAQGFLWSPPLPPAAALDWMRDHPGRP